MAPNPYPAPGEILDDKYRVEKLLGEGGMGAVARATHLLLHRTVAVKFMNPQFMTFPGAVERFLNEGRASGAIKSDHVVPVSDVGCLPTGTPYLVMECLYGLDLADLLARDGPSGLPIQRAVHFVVQILRGLQAAHAIGIIHRDMKPSNCFVVTHDGEEDFVKILDFGISKIAQPGSASLTQTNSALGTPLYMSPEQARSPRDVDQRSDLYSVGVILYELLSGHTPFFSESGEFTEILFQLFTADPPPIKQTRPDLPDDLAAIVHKALSREVPERYASALEMAEALLPFAGPKTHALVERMRTFKAPSMESIVPTEGLPTSMAAFSQLQKGAGTDVMANRPTTDVQKGPPVTEILNAPISPNTKVLGPVQPKTALLPNQPRGQAPHVSATPELFSMRARPEDALGRTQLEMDPKIIGSSLPPKEQPAAQTDLGASRDTTAAEAAAAATQRRSPVVWALPIVAVLGLAGGAAAFVANSKKTTGSDAPPQTASTAMATTPTNVTSQVASTPSTLASAPPSASVSASASASASAPKPKQVVPVPHVPSDPAEPGLDVGIKGLKR